MPPRIVLEENAEYDLGRCSESDLETVWAVGNLAADRRSSDGFPHEPGRTVVIVKMEGDVAGTADAAVDPHRSAEAILAESWDYIVHVRSEERRVGKAYRSRAWECRYETRRRRIRE